MKRTTCIALLALLSGCMLVAPLFAADFATIFPKQGAPVVAPPNFTWAVGDYDLFVLYLLLPIPIPGHWYTPIPVPLYQQPFWKCPDALWDYLLVDPWCLWLVLGINTATHAYEVTSWQCFQKENDCVVNFPDANLEAVIRQEIGKPTGDIMASDVQVLDTIIYARWPSIWDISGLEHCINLTNLKFSVFHSNQIVDVSPLAGLTNLTSLYLDNNQIVDTCPLVDNLGLDSGDSVSLDSNPLSTTSCTVCIPQLEGRSVYVTHDCP